MTKPNSIHCALLQAGCLALLSAGAVTAEETVSRFIPYVGVELGMGTFSFDKKLDQTLVFPMANLTAGLARGKFNLAANASGSIADADVSEEDFTGDASRQDFDITAGYQVHENISLFVGYKDGETELSLKSRDEDNPTSGDEYYRQSGPYVGANFHWRFRNTSTFNLSLAYGDLEAENRFFGDGDGDDPDEDIEFDDINGKTSGDSTGYSANIAWTMPLGDSLAFRTRFRYNSYEQDIRYQGVKFSGIKEETAMLTVGVIGFF